MELDFTSPTQQYMDAISPATNAELYGAWFELIFVIETNILSIVF